MRALPMHVAGTQRAAAHQALAKGGRQREGYMHVVKTLSVTMLAALLAATMLTPAGAADMTHERALNAAKEPQNWLLHYGNYEGHRFSALKNVNTGNVKNLKVAFTVPLSGYESGGRSQFG